MESGVSPLLRPYLSLLIILPADREDEDPDRAKELAGIVYEVNETHVLEQDILSYHVYRYNRENGEVTIAA